MKLAVCDDNTEYLIYLNEQIKMWFAQKEMKMTTDIISPDELLTKLENVQFEYDIVFLDIKMGNYDGIRLAKLINAITPHCKIVFITNYLELATQVYEVSHTCFILKSELKKRLPLALEKAVGEAVHEDTKHIMITSNFHRVCLFAKDILYADVYGRKVTIYLADGEKYVTNQALKKLHDKLPDFLRIHNSFLVNPAHIRVLTKETCTLSDSTILPVSRTYSKKASESYSRYLAALL